MERSILIPLITQIPPRDQRLDGELIERISEDPLKHLLSLCGALCRGERLEGGEEAG